MSRSPASALGIRAATRGRGAGAVLAGSATAIAAVTATLVFSSSVVHLVDTPARYGWSYDTGVLVNAGYGLTDVDAVRATLDRPEVKRWGIAALAGGLSINETTIPFVASGEGFEAFIAEDSVVTGRLPTAPDELALGTRTARDLGVAIGDEVVVSTPSGDASARVSGLVALPALGPFESERSALGTGALLSQGLHEQLLGQAADRTGKSGPELAALMGTFVAIDFADDVVAADFMASVGEQLRNWDPFRVPPEVYTEPVRPASVVDVAAMRQVPVLLAGAFALAMAASMVAGIASGTRARRRELAVFRALGGTPRQIRASVRWHASAVVVIGLVVGLPIGVVIGRLAFAAFARDLGVAPRPFVPLLLVVFTVIVVLAIGSAASIVPGRRAVARREHLDATRSQRTVTRSL